MEGQMASKKAKKKYGRKASRKVGQAMHEMKEGTLRSGGSGRKVKSRKQAIAIGLSEARREGGKVPRTKKKAPVRSKPRAASRKKSAGRRAARKSARPG
jgi:hypothetical protein